MDDRRAAAPPSAAPRPTAALSHPTPTADAPSTRPPAAPTSGARGAGRDTSIDVLRGWFVISMTLAHLAAGSVAERLAHVAVWLDGAMGFVTLSGLVLGMVYRRSRNRTGRVPYAKALRRVRLLYVIQVGM